MLALFFLIGCASHGDQPSTALAGVRENGVLALTQSDNNRTAELQVGERLQIRLPENPTTGFSWAIDENDRRILALDNTAYTPPAEAGFIGARGQRTFTFTGRQPGEVGLKLKYWRILGGDGTITQRVGFTIRVIASPDT
jgi:inhibitor of cysteine peptidase